MPSREIPPDDQARIDAFLQEEASKIKRKDGPRDSERRELESLRSGKPLTPLEAIQLAERYKATVKCGK